MAKKQLPDKEYLLKHLLAVAKDFLDFTEPVVRQLEHQRRAVEVAILEKRFDLPFFRKVHEALMDRIAQGGPSYTDILPYLDGPVRKPLKRVEAARMMLSVRIRTAGRTEKSRSIHLFLATWEIFEIVWAARAAVQAVQALQGEIIEKLSRSATPPVQEPQPPPQQ